MVNISRRHFLGSSAAFACFGRSAFGADEKPLFTAGFMTDTHIRAEAGTCERVRRAYALFRKLGVDLIANLGDIADMYCEEGYRHYRAIREATYPDPAKRPQEVFLWANHDRLDFGGTYRGDYAASFAAAKPILGIPNEMVDRFEKGGYTFLVFHQEIALERYERAIEEACAANPGKPVFVLNHVPPVRPEPGVDKANGFTKVLRRHPQVVNFSGHVHGTLRDEALIWQDGFTSVNFGCLANWGGHFLGRPPEPHPGWDVAHLAFYRDRLVIRRHSLKDGSEFGGEDPWTVVWGESDRYRLDLRARREAKPAFPSGAAVAVGTAARTVGAPAREVRVTFPGAEDFRKVRGYRLTIERAVGSGWETLALRELCGDFHREPGDPAQTSFTDAITAAFFESGVRYRFAVRPFGIFGTFGEPIATEWTAPAVADGEALCDVKEGLPVLRGGDHYELPAAVQGFPKGTLFRAIVDAESDVPDGLSLSFRMQCYPRKEILSAWANVEPGHVTRRYVIDFMRGEGDQRMSLAAPFSDARTTLALKRVRITLR